MSGQGDSSAAIGFRRELRDVARQFGYHLVVDYASMDGEGVMVRKMGRKYR